MVLHFLVGYRRGDEARYGYALRLHGPHGDDPPERGRDPELLRQIRRHHLQRVPGLGAHSHRMEVSQVFNGGEQRGGGEYPLPLSI